MTVDGYSYDGWTIHPDYRTKSGVDDSSPLRRCQKSLNLPASTTCKTRNIFKKIVGKS